MRPPEPDPVLNYDDPQKGRWGGLPERDGRRLFAVLVDATKKTFWVDLIVQSIDGSPLKGPIVYHLHDSYHKSVQSITKIRNGRWAVYKEVNANGVYTVGAQVQDATGRWISLELDLATLPNLPSRFHEQSEPRRRRQSTETISGRPAPAITLSVQRGGRTDEERRSDLSKRGLERLVRRLDFHNPVRLRTWLAYVEGWVCRIRVDGDPAGTGFLIGPDVVLTTNFPI